MVCCVLCVGGLKVVLVVLLVYWCIRELLAFSIWNNDEY